jgi:hypothetical protein
MDEVHQWDPLNSLEECWDLEKQAQFSEPWNCLKTTMKSYLLTVLCF